VIDIVEKSGLFRLKCTKARDPRSPAFAAQAVQGSFGDPNGDNGRLRGAVAAGSDWAIDDGPSYLSELDGTYEDSDNYDTEMEAIFGASATTDPCCGPFTGAASGVGTPTSKVGLELLHRRTGHFAYDVLESMVYRGAWRDIGLADRKRCSVCDVCASNKATRRSVPREREELQPETKPFARVWTDVKGKVTPDFWGNVYCVTFTCEATRWTVPFVCKLKSEVVEKFKEFLAWTRSHGWTVKQLNSDGGGEYTAPEFASVRSEFQRVCVATTFGSSSRPRIRHRRTAFRSG